jgi:hypothetical protein
VRIRSSFALVGAATLLAACATTPTGPAVTVMPGSGKSFEAFQQDAAQCQQYAQASLGGPNAGQAVNDRAAGTAVAGSALGAATGAIIGSASNQGGQGAAIGAGVGLLFGAISAANASTPPVAIGQCDGAYSNACMRTTPGAMRMSYRGQTVATASGMCPPQHAPPTRRPHAAAGHSAADMPPPQ